jgi:pimeloyl-ACP methyl ester carboxylesterase
MPTESFVDVAGAKTRVLTEGRPDAPVVVLVHDGAWGASADVTWGALLPLVAADHFVIAPDMLGFGGTAKVVQLDSSPYEFRTRHIFALLDQLGITRPAHFVGNSFGGSLVLQATTRPEWAVRMASATSISGTGGPWRTAKAQAELGHYDGTEPDMRRLVSVLVDDFAGTHKQVLDRMHWAAQPGHYAAMLAPHTAVPAVLRSERPASNYPADLKGAGVPILVITGERDDLVEPGWTANLTEIEPAIQTALLPTMHSPNISHAALTWGELEPFLDNSGTTAESLRPESTGLCCRSGESVDVMFERFSNVE